MRFGCHKYLLLLGFALALASTASAGVIVINIEALIDGTSFLYIQGNTMQWENQSWCVPGKHGDSCGDTDQPAILNTSLNGVPQLVDYNWFPGWPDGIFGHVWSDQFTGLIPALPSQDMTVELEVLQGRYWLGIWSLPSSDNGYTLTLDFNDDPPAGSAWYEARLTITYEDGGPGGVPEPATSLLIGAGLIGIFGLLRRKS